jgi:hypothetical protein
MDQKSIEVIKEFLVLENNILSYSSRYELNELIKLINTVSYSQLRKLNRIRRKMLHQNTMNENNMFYVNHDAKIPTIERISRTRINYIELIMMDTIYRNINAYKASKNLNYMFSINIDRIMKDELVIEPCIKYLKYTKDQNNSDLYEEILLYINENRYYLLEENSNLSMKKYLDIGLSVM